MSPEANSKTVELWLMTRDENRLGLIEHLFGDVIEVC
ncbi:MAG: hypothetical protein QOI77_3578 [Blastocatellia bacterium]|nr:hypothetical protein [Blastocatellia bacterium]